MLRTILWLAVGYLAVIGLVRVVAGLVELIAPPKAPKGCRLYLTVNGDAEYTESSLIGCGRLLHRGETGGLPCAVVLPQAPEAAEICRRYCRDWHIETLDLPPELKWCMIEKTTDETGPEAGMAGMEAKGKDGEPRDGTGAGEDLRDSGGCDLPQ